MNSIFDRWLEQDDSAQPQLTDILEAAPLAICILEMPAARYIQANSRYCQMVFDHAGPGEVVGRTMFEVLPSQNCEALESLYRAHEKNEPTRFGRLISHNRLSGETFWTGAVVPIFRCGGNTYVIALLAEITDQVLAKRNAQEKEAALSETLERLVEERRKKNEFVAMAVHELRTPVTSLKTMTQLMLRQLQRGAEFDRADLQRRLERLDKQSTQLARLITDLSDSTKIVADKVVVVNQPTALAKLVTEAVSQCQILNPTHELKLKLGPDTGHLLANIDPGRFTQVLMNICGNAVKYSAPESTIEVSLSTSDAQTNFIVEVRDHGVGISKDSLSKVFDCYFQAPERPNAGGLGLGLFLAKDMISRMSGRIWAESDGHGQGSSFFIEVPVTSGFTMNGVAPAHQASVTPANKESA